jgi:hypothetical protein
MPSLGPKSVGAQVRKYFPDVITVQTADVHQPASVIEHQFADTAGAAAAVRVGQIRSEVVAAHKLALVDGR